MELSDFKKLIGSARWIFAKTMPQNPHWYILRQDISDDVFCDAVMFIREHGEVVIFKGHPYIQYQCEGYTYWTMGNPIDQTKLINRARYNPASVVSSV